MLIICRFRETQQPTTKIGNRLASWFPNVGCRYGSVMGNMNQLPGHPCQVREGLETRSCQQKRDRDPCEDWHPLAVM